MPQVSVIIATYNREHFLFEAIKSVLKQTYQDFELIVIDDGSTDNTKTMIAKFDDSRLYYTYQPNRGRSNARNSGLRLAKGRYIAFLDSDDLYLPEKLVLQVKYLDSNPHVGMIYTSAYCIDHKGNLLSHHYKATASGNIYKKIAFFVPVTITLPTVMVRREILAKAGGFDEKMHRFEDTDLWRRIAKITCIDAINTFTCKLRTHDDNILAAQNPKELVDAIHDYVQKIINEDSEQSILSRNCGIGGLYFHYACAMKRVPHLEFLGNELQKIACTYWPWYYLKLQLKKFLLILKRKLSFS